MLHELVIVSMFVSEDFVGLRRYAHAHVRTFWRVFPRRSYAEQNPWLRVPTNVLLCARAHLKPRAALSLVRPLSKRARANSSRKHARVRIGKLDSTNERCTYHIGLTRAC